MGEAEGLARESAETLFTCEYSYENDLIMDFAMQQASPERKRTLLIAGAIALAIGAGLLLVPTMLRWLGIIPLCFGITCLWQRANLFQNISHQLIAQMDEDDKESGGRHRLIEVNEGGLTVTTPNGARRRFDFSGLTDVRQTKRMWILVFGQDGVVLPYEGFTCGTSEQFGEFIRNR